MGQRMVKNCLFLSLKVVFQSPMKSVSQSEFRCFFHTKKSGTTPDFSLQFTRLSGQRQPALNRSAPSHSQVPPIHWLRLLVDEPPPQLGSAQAHRKQTPMRLCRFDLNIVIIEGVSKSVVMCASKWELIALCLLLMIVRKQRLCVAPDCDLGE